MNKYSTYFALEKNMKLSGQKTNRHELISAFTNHRKHSLSDLTDWEYKEFVNWLKRTFPAANSNKNSEKKQAPIVSEAEAKEADRKNKMRRKIIHIFHKMDYKKPDGSADMQHINSWAINYGHAHKNLNDYTYNELCVLVTQAEKLYNSFIKTV